VMRNFLYSICLSLFCLFLAAVLLGLGLMGIMHGSSASFQVGIILIGLSLWFLWLVINVMYSELKILLKGGK